VTAGEGALVREAGPADNDALLALCGACPMRGEITLAVERAPDFFALGRLAGDPHRVFVAETAEGRLIGVVGALFFRGYLRGEPARLAYLGDMRVLPGFRGAPYGAVDRMVVHAIEVCRPDVGDHLPVIALILAGNRDIEKRIPGVRGLPPLTRFATVRNYSIPLLWAPRPPRDRTVVEATAGDVGEMMALWRRLAPAEQLAGVLDESSFARFVADAPGLGIGSYRLARDRAGRLLGFWGLWDQSPIKQLRVLSYARRMRLARLAFNAVARPAFAAPLPPPGGTLGMVNAIHLCAPLDDPSVLRTLLLAALRELRGRGASLLGLSLDVRDPRAAALAGRMAQSVTVHAYVVTPTGPWAGPPLDDRPMHLEVALV
jgi:hypothetical protein